jgi:hypothetical protein
MVMEQLSMSTSSNAGREYLTNYGVTDARREKRFFRVAAIVIGSALLGTFLYYYFRTFYDERQVKDFLAMLARKDYKAAYAKFGCPQECRDYKFTRFLEDFGEKSSFAEIDRVKITLAEPCGNRGWISVKHPQHAEIGLSVDPNDRTVTFAPEARCPGVWRMSEFPGRLWTFIKRRMA